MPRYALAEGLWLPNGFFVPCGYGIGINPFVVQRDIGTFGEDVEEFRLERWLEANASQLRKMNAAMLTFGAGTRTCTGRHVSAPMLVNDLRNARIFQAGNGGDLQDRARNPAPFHNQYATGEGVENIQRDLQSDKWSSLWLQEKRYLVAFVGERDKTLYCAVWPGKYQANAFSIVLLADPFS